MERDKWWTDEGSMDGDYAYRLVYRPDLEEAVIDEMEEFLSLTIAKLRRRADRRRAAIPEPCGDAI